MIFIGLYATVAIVCLLTNNGRTRMQRQTACICIFIYMQLIIGLRHIQYGGVDTQVYARDFTRIVNQDYSIIEIFIHFYKDFGFYLFAKLFSLFSPDMNAWLFACAVPFTFGVTWLIYKYSKNIFLSFIMFLSFGFYLYNFQLVRHVFALGLTVLAFKFLNEGSYKKYFAAVMAAMFFHMVAALFLAAYFIRKDRINLKQFVWIIAGGVVTLLLSDDAIITTVFNVIPLLRSGRFATYSTRGGSLSSDFLIWLLFVLMCGFLLFRKNTLLQCQPEQIRIKEKRKGFTLRIGRGKYEPAAVNMPLLFNMAVIGTVFYLMTVVIGVSYRMAHFFSLFTIILVPNTLRLISERKLKMLIIAVIVVFGVRHFFGGLFMEGSAYNPYVFFWERAQSLY